MERQTAQIIQPPTPGSDAHALYQLRSLLVTACRDCPVRDRARPGLYCRELKRDVTAQCRDGAPFCPLGKQAQGIIGPGQTPDGAQALTTADGTLSILVPRRTRR